MEEWYLKYSQPSKSTQTSWHFDAPSVRERTMKELIRFPKLGEHDATVKLEHEEGDGVVVVVMAVVVLVVVNVVVVIFVVVVVAGVVVVVVGT